MRVETGEAHAFKKEKWSAPASNLQRARGIVFASRSGIVDALWVRRRVCDRSADAVREQEQREGGEHLCCSGLHRACRLPLSAKWRDVTDVRPIEGGTAGRGQGVGGCGTQAWHHVPYTRRYTRPLVRSLARASPPPPTK